MGRGGGGAAGGTGEGPADGEGRGAVRRSQAVEQEADPFRIQGGKGRPQGGARGGQPQEHAPAVRRIPGAPQAAQPHQAIHRQRHGGGGDPQPARQVADRHRLPGVEVAEDGGLTRAEAPPRGRAAPRRAAAGGGETGVAVEHGGDGGFEHGLQCRENTLICQIKVLKSGRLRATIQAVPTPMPSIDLNADLGEGFAIYRLPHEPELLTLVSSANVACGAHAGDPVVMRETVARAAAAGVVIGAHPGYPDREGFGRRELGATPAEIAAMVIAQIGALAAVCAAAGTRLRYVKPHGALYHRVARDVEAARAMAGAIHAVDPALVLLGLDGSVMLREGEELGLTVAREGFVDRAYRPDGTLLPRGEPGALLTDPARVADRAVRMVREHHVVAVDGTRHLLRPHSLCTHGDGPDAAALVRAVRAGLEQAGIGIAPFVS